MPQGTRTSSSQRRPAIVRGMAFGAFFLPMAVMAYAVLTYRGTCGGWLASLSGARPCSIVEHSYEMFVLSVAVLGGPTICAVTFVATVAGGGVGALVSVLRERW